MTTTGEGNDMSEYHNANQRNAEAMRRIIEEGFGQGNPDVLDELMDPDLVEHQPGIADREGVKAAIRTLHVAFPDMNVEAQHLTTDGDLVWIHFRASGTHLGPLGRVPPTNRPMTIDVMDLCRFRDGRVVEHWGVPDRFSQAQQLGLLPG